MPSSNSDPGPSRDNSGSDSRKRKNDNDDENNDRTKKMQKIHIEVEVFQKRSPFRQSKSKHLKFEVSGDRGVDYQVNVAVDSDSDKDSLEIERPVDPNASNLVAKFNYSIDVHPFGAGSDECPIQSLEIKQNDCTIRLPIMNFDTNNHMDTSFGITCKNGQTAIFATEINMDHIRNEIARTYVPERREQVDGSSLQINEDRPSNLITSEISTAGTSQELNRGNNLMERLIGSLGNTLSALSRDKKMIGFLVQSGSNALTETISQLFLTEIAETAVSTGTVQEFLIRNEPRSQEHSTESVRQITDNVSVETETSSESENIVNESLEENGERMLNGHQESETENEVRNDTDNQPSEHRQSESENSNSDVNEIDDEQPDSRTEVSDVSAEQLGVEDVTEPDITNTENRPVDAEGKMSEEEFESETTDDDELEAKNDE